MYKFTSRVLALAIVVVGLIFAFGAMRGSKVTTELSVYLPYSQDYVYSIYTDISNYPYRKRNLDNVEVLETAGERILRWRENYKNGSWREYLITEIRRPNIFDYQIVDSSDGYTGTFTTTFKQTSEFTEITFTEEGVIPQTFNRGLRFVFGEKSFLKREAKWLRVAILDEQIARR